MPEERTAPKVVSSKTDKVVIAKPSDKAGTLLKVLGVVVFLIPILVIGWWLDPATSKADRVLMWAFAVFAIGFAELFLFVVGCAFFGKLPLLDALRDKDPKETSTSPAASLSRIQALLWTLVIITLYFHQAVTRGPDEGLPAIPPELLLVMGISSSVYLASKNMQGKRKNDPAAPPEGQKPEQTNEPEDKES